MALNPKKPKTAEDMAFARILQILGEATFRNAFDQWKVKTTNDVLNLTERTLDKPFVLVGEDSARQEHFLDPTNKAKLRLVIAWFRAQTLPTVHTWLTLTEESLEAFRPTFDAAVLESLNDEMNAKYKCIFQERFISVGSSLDPLLSPTSEHRTISLDFLDPLRLPDSQECFLPRQIYVRDSMRTIFGLFREDSEENPSPDTLQSPHGIDWFTWCW